MIIYKWSQIDFDVISERFVSGTSFVYSIVSLEIEAYNLIQLIFLVLECYFA